MDDKNGMMHPANDGLPSSNGFSGLSEGASPNFPSTHSAHQPSAGPTLAPKRRRPHQKRLNLAEMIKMMYRGRWIILVTFILVFAYTVYSTYSKPPIYASTTRMFIEKPIGSNQVVNIIGKGAEEDHSISNQIQFFKSHLVGQHVARLLHEYAEGNRYEIDSLFTSAFGSAKDVPPDPRQIAIIRMQDNPKLPNHRGIPDVQTLEARATSAVTIAPEGNNDYLAVATEAYTPLDAAFIANTFVAVFVKDNQTRVRQNSAALKQYLFTQKERSFDTLRKIENRLRDYLGENNGMSPEEISKGITEQYQTLKQKRTTVDLDLNVRRKMYEELVANLDTVQKNYYNNLSIEPAVTALQQQIFLLEEDISQEQMNNSLMDPRTKKYIKDEVQAKKDRLEMMKEKLKEKVDDLLHSQVTPPTIIQAPDGNPELSFTTQGSSLGTITSLRQNILGTKLRIAQDSTYLQDLDQKLEELHIEAQSTPDKIVETSQLRRAQNVAEKMYSQLEDRYLEAWMTEESVFGNIKAEDPASLNATPIRPNRQASIFQGAIIGLGLGISIVVILSFLDSTIRTPDEVESQNVPLLGTIPIINHPSQPLTLEATTGTERVRFTPHRASHLDPRSSVAESYRALRTSIQFAELDKPIQTIAISSSAPQEGKSTTSSNLGIVMAQMGKRTVIVDTDLRRPVLHSVFGVDREPGLTNILFDRANIAEGLKETDVPNLFILPCGVIPPNPAELLGSQRMAFLLEELRTMFDIIILDTPPVVAVTDALILGRLADATLLVARADVTRTDALMRAVDSVEKSGSRFLGVILNNFNVANAYGSYYRYYQYYHYYSTGATPKRGLFQRFLPGGRGAAPKKSRESSTV